MNYLNILILLLSVSAPYSSGDPYIPKALRNKYKAFQDGDNNYNNEVESFDPNSPPGLPPAGVKTAGVKTAGVKTAGVKTAGVKTAGVKTAGVKTGYGGGTYDDNAPQKTFQKVEAHKGGKS